MASISSKNTVFFVTSPRSPLKMIDEVKFLSDNFSGKTWNKETQAEFYLELSKQPFFEGAATGDLALKARDRISRGPKSLGFIDLKPQIKLTDTGEEFLSSHRTDEILLRQLLKFQFPSPYHPDSKGTFNIKPYLELMRMVFEMDGLTKNEIALFVIQMINHRDYQKIKGKVEKFRSEAKQLRERKISYKQFVFDKFEVELAALFKDKIDNGEVSIRQSSAQSLEKFMKTKRANHLDYADAAIRYLRATGLFTLNPRSSKIFVIPEKIKDLEYLLAQIPRDAESYDDSGYKKYLFNASEPKLLTDNRDQLIAKILAIDVSIKSDELVKMTIDDLKDIYERRMATRRNLLINDEKRKLRTYAEYADIVQTFDDIRKKNIADPSLQFEWNAWRAFSMLNDGSIDGNFRVDDDGVPLYPAPGNNPDIICKYKDFEAIVEVTLSSGQRQHDMEGESVARHYGDLKLSTDKDAYGIFIAPTINPATIAHYYGLYKSNIKRYGGIARVIPISLGNFERMLSNANTAKRKPTASDLKSLWKKMSDAALIESDEEKWALAINELANSAFI